jgi:hypothetical protein
MNARAFDLVTRSLTTAILALGVLIVVAYEAIAGKGVDGQTGAAFGLIIGVYFGAHVSQNGSSARARRDQIITSESTGAPLPPDDMVGIRSPNTGSDA